MTLELFTDHTDIGLDIENPLLKFLIETHTELCDLMVNELTDSHLDCGPFHKHELSICVCLYLTPLAER